MGILTTAKIKLHLKCFCVQQGLLFYLIIPQTTDRKNSKSVLVCLEQHS